CMPSCHYRPSHGGIAVFDQHSYPYSRSVYSMSPPILGFHPLLMGGFLHDGIRHGNAFVTTLQGHTDGNCE
ncbi:hypothetical protein, partial [Mesorhizobium japonicum]|uniref:hypothetical protein n=1 Tax=Mesorhizobium japonicum TaxID=2066070 RepID=UPI003B594176